MPDEIQREILPIPDRPHTGLVTYYAKDPDDHDHFIEPEERVRLAMARQ